MKKLFSKNLFIWAVVFLMVCGGIFLLYVHFDRHHASGNSITDVSPLSLSEQSEQTIENNDQGYSLNIPSSWYAEKNSSDTITVYPDYSPARSSSLMCKIEMSAFPYSSTTSISDWISGRLGADPTVSVVEQSSEDISIGAASGIKWSGVINDVSTTIVYAFNEHHAYEIVPSQINDGSGDSGECNNDLETFLKKLTL